MAQAQLEFTEEAINYLQQNGLETVQWSPVLHQVYCKLDNKLSLVVKKTEHSYNILLKKGSTQIKLSIDQFRCLCDLKQSVHLLKSFLDGQ
jgi:hypothetical protein